MPKLSVLLPVYNAEKYLAETIQSILDQTFTDFELIIADDGSNDQSKKIIESFSDSRIIICNNNINKGKVYTTNKIFELASGDYITIHDADDISFSHRFETQIKRMELSKNLVLTGCFFEEFEDSYSRIIKLPVANSDIKSHLLKESAFHGPTMIFRRSLINNRFIYRDFFKDYNEDVDLSYRLCTKGEVENIPQVLYKYRVNSSGLSKRRKPPELLAYSSLIIDLYKIRLNSGSDYLDDANDIQFHELWQNHLMKYRRNPYLVFDKNAGFFLWYNMYGKAFKEWFLLFNKKPFYIRTWRGFFYILKEMIVKKNNYKSKF